MPLNNFAEVIPIIAAQVWLPGDTTTFKDILAAQPTIYRFDVALAINDDSVIHVFALQLKDPTGGIHGFGSVSIPANAGHTTVPMFDVFANLFPVAQVGIAVPVGWILEGALLVTATNAVGLVLTGGYF